MIYDFNQMLEFSKGENQGDDINAIKSLIDGCASVSTSSIELDKIGVDYIATLRRGAEVYVDAKRRQSGCSKFWSNGVPELAIEVWSVMPGGRFNTPRTQAKIGWTLDEQKVTDMILYTFDLQDSKSVYLFPFQSLRMAARRNLNKWKKQFKVDIQTSGSWQSEAVFVPWNVVRDATAETFSCNANASNQQQLLMNY